MKHEIEEAKALINKGTNALLEREKVIKSMITNAGKDAAWWIISDFKSWLTAQAEIGKLTPNDCMVLYDKLNKRYEKSFGIKLTGHMSELESALKTYAGYHGCGIDIGETLSEVKT